MQLISLQLQDLRSYRKASIEFAPGVNAIVGDNGAGKSTVLAAIGLALFNTRPPSATNDELVREGAKTAEIVVDFVSALDERRYQVVRRFGGSNQYRVLDPDRGHQLLVEGVADCESWLRQHLGVGPDTSLSDLFQHTIGVYQGTFTAPFLLTPAVRKPIFDPLLRVDEYPKAALALQAPRRELGDQDQAVARCVWPRSVGVCKRCPACGESWRRRKGASQGANAPWPSSRAGLDVARQQCQAFDRLRTAAVRGAAGARPAGRRAGSTAGQLWRPRADCWLTPSELLSLWQTRSLVTSAICGPSASAPELEEARQRRDQLASARGAARDAPGRQPGRSARAARAVGRVGEDRGCAPPTLAPLAAQQAVLEAALSRAQEALRDLQAARQTAADLERRSAQQADRVAQLQDELAERERLTAEQAAAQANVERLQHETAAAAVATWRMSGRQGAARKAAR